jgi:hypothetical protein
MTHLGNEDDDLKKRNQSWDVRGRHFILPVVFLSIFLAVAITLWLTQNNVFYLLNFSYIGLSVAIGLFFLQKCG